jgi:hypothetical protein
MEMPLVRVNRRFHYVEQLSSVVSGREFNITNVSTGPVWAILEQHPSMETWRILPFPLPRGITARHFLNAKMRHMTNAIVLSTASRQVGLDFKLFVYKAGPEIISDPCQCIEIQYNLTVPTGSPAPYDILFNLSPQ